jgi:anti-sigma factor RsiW
MNCEQAGLLLNSFLAGRLSGEPSREVRNHLASCASCAAKLSRVDRIEILIAEDQGIEPSADLPLRFRRRLEEHRRRRQGEAVPERQALFRYLAWGWPRQIAAAASLALLFAAAIFVGRQMTRQNGEGRIVSEIGIAENLPLLLDMDVIENLDLLQDFDLIQNLSAGGGNAPVPR